MEAHSKHTSSWGGVCAAAMATGCHQSVAASDISTHEFIVRLTHGCVRPGFLMAILSSRPLSICLQICRMPFFVPPSLPWRRVRIFLNNKTRQGRERSVRQLPSDSFANKTAPASTRGIFQRAQSADQSK